ncbi:hypothetical protein WJX79_005812 [Trebouxia sp. C0005]
MLCRHWKAGKPNSAGQQLSTARSAAAVAVVFLRLAHMQGSTVGIKLAISPRRREPLPLKNINILELFLAKRHEDWAQDFVIKQQPNLPEKVYITLITLCSEHNSLKTLNAVLEAQCRAGGVLTKAAFRKAKVAFDRVHDVDAVLRWFERAVASSRADTDVYCDAIESCIDSRKYKIAFRIYDQLQRSGLELTLHSYHTVLKGSRHLQATGLQDLYAQMIADRNLVLKDKTFGYVFRAAATCGEGLPASWLIQVLSDMNTHRAPDRALDVWQAMQEDGVPPSSYLLSSMFAACAAAGTQEMLEAADSSHMHMEGLWNKICSKGKTYTEERDMLWAHNALLHVYASHGQVEKAKQLYSSMQERGPAIDAVSGSTIIAAYAKAADQKAALQVFDEMVSQGMKPTPQCYTSLLAACSRAGDLTAARRVFRTMHVDRNVAAYTALMDACLKKGTPAALDEAFEVFEEMKAGGNLKPTATTYGCLLMVCARQGAVDRAFLLYEEAYDTGVLATDECHNILIGICSDAGRVEEALDLVKALASKHGSMRQATLNSLIRSLLNVAQVPRALRMLSIMLNLGLKPYKSTVNALIAGCARDSSSVEAAKFYWGLREQGGEASRASGSELIVSLSALVHAFAIADDIHQCDRLYQQLQRDKRGLPGLTQFNRRMWESTIEAACRAGRTDWALQVFDDWKASSMTFMFVQPADQAKPAKLPSLSNATLAFLESCCRGSPEHEWRVYDVCAVMRQQKERKREAALARPAKKSHHVADAV